MGTVADTPLEELLAGLTPLQLHWVRWRIDERTKSDREASRLAGVDKDCPGRWKAAGVPLDAIVEAARRDGVLLVRERMVRDVNDAYDVKRDGLRSKDEHIRQSVSSEILDRVIGKPAQRQEVTGPGGGPIKTAIAMDYSSLSDEELCAIISRRSRSGDGEPDPGPA